MKQLQAKFIYTVILCLGFTNFIQARLTTLRHFDPAPNYSANDSMMPPNSEFIALQHARIKQEQPNKKRRFGINISGFWQKAIQARGYTGNTVYGTTIGESQNAFELGDFRGTLYAMGLFLGRNPNNGRVIYYENYSDSDPEHYVTPQSISCFDLPPCLSNIANGLIQPTNCTGPIISPNPDGCCPRTIATPAPSCPTNCEVTNPLIFYPNGSAPGATPPSTFETISIFSPRKLAEDTIYFGAFSLPINYQQTGVRLELNFQVNDYIGLTVQTGASNIKQYYVNTLNLPSTATPPTSPTPIKTNYGPYSLSNQLGTSNTLPNLYGAQLNQLGSTTVSPNATAQGIFNQYISNNINNILNPDCLDSNPICNFDKYSWDDIRAILTFSKSFEPFRARHDEDDDPGSWPDTIFMPYTWIGGSAPVAKKTNYRNILALPFGNDGHGSLGGGLGFNFDFAESVEIGVEGGATYFFAHKQTRPFPTHELQRLLYPFEATVKSQPGMNWHFKALLHAYQFLKHVNFWFTYELIEHEKDCYTICDSDKAQYYVPEVLTCRSDWRAQFFNAAVIFNIMPGLELSFVWQQPINPRNAYYPVSIMGSVNFLF